LDQDGNQVGNSVWLNEFLWLDMASAPLTTLLDCDLLLDWQSGSTHKVESYLRRLDPHEVLAEGGIDIDANPVSPTGARPAGDEVLGGTGRADRLIEKGDDELSRRRGEDVLIAGGDDDRLDGGGGGADLFVFDRREGRDRVEDFRDSPSRIALTGADGMGDLCIVKGGDGVLVDIARTKIVVKAADPRATTSCSAWNRESSDQGSVGHRRESHVPGVTCSLPTDATPRGWS
jgi:hypothetical protein